MCSYHRNGLGKLEVTAVKKRIGCQNTDGHLGWKCAGTHDPDVLTFDHVDGNKHNVTPENIEILCANCHNKKTKVNGDTQSSYFNINGNFDNLFKFV
jgi:5-methylcytosine-specific restriction endonuclease McrA